MDELSSTPKGAGTRGNAGPNHGDWTWDRVVRVNGHTSCSYQKGCLLNAYVKDGAVIRVEQTDGVPPQNDPDVPDWGPRGCHRCLVYAHHMYDATRLKTPLKRAGRRGEGQWQVISWDQALTEIADTMLDVLTTDGPDSIISFGGSGGGVASEGIGYEALLTALGISTYNPTGEVGDFHNGSALMFGQPFLGCSADNYYYADVLLVWGGNPAYTNVTNYHFITEARYHGTKIVAITPDYSPSAVQADRWVPVKPGTDAALALSIAQLMIAGGTYNANFLREQTDLPLLVQEDPPQAGRYLREKDLKRGGRDDVFYFWDSRLGKAVVARRDSLALGDSLPTLEGEFTANTLDGKVRVKPVFQLLKEKLDSEYTPEKVSEATGVSPAVIRGLANDLAAGKRVTILCTFSLGKYYQGDLIDRAIALVFVLGGHFGRKGDTFQGIPQLATDASIGGESIRGNVLLRAAASGDPRFARWQVEGYTQEMMLLEYAKDMWASGSMFGGSLFHYIHSGLLEQSLKHNSWDPTLKRPLKAYVDEAFDKGWQTSVPRAGKDPRIILNVGGSTLRKARSTETILRTLLPKLRMLVSIDFRMGSTDLYADYVLPAAGWWEKHSFQGVTRTELPLAFLVNKAVEPVHESKGEWEIGCLLAREIEERARARGVVSFVDREGKTRRLDNLHQRVTVNGLYMEEDEEAVSRDYYTNTANVEPIPWEELKEKGFTIATGIGVAARSIGNACDIVPGEPLVPFVHHTDGKQPYPTLTRRMQVYVDHDLYLELGQGLPVHRESPLVGGSFPLQVSGGHARWSIHSNQIDDALVLRLQRGVPTMFMSAEDACARGIADGDTVGVFNDIAAFEINVSVSPAVRPGQLIIYHAWENYQFPGKRHFKGVMASPLNPIHLAGGYGHIRPWAACFYPGFSDRDTRVEVRKSGA